MKQIINCFSMPRVAVYPLTLRNINVDGEGPITFGSSAELRRYCRRHGLASAALL